MAKVLVVEDEEDFFENIGQAFSDLGVQCEVTWAQSRDSALREASNGFFDLTVLDQKIPTIDGALDAHVDHGRAVWDELYNSSPGMPVLILTALSADDIISTVVRRSKHQRIWGGVTKFPTVEHVRKSNFEKFPEIIASYISSIDALRDIEVQVHDGTNLDEQQRRLCQLFVSRNNGVRCKVRKLSGGLSGSAVYHLFVFDSYGGKIQNAVLKVGTKEMVDAENENLGLINRLQAAASPRLLESLYFGVKDLAAIAYQLAEGYDRNIFDLIEKYPGDLPAALAGISNQRQSWVDAKSQMRKSVADVRRTVLADASAAELSKTYGLDWLPAFESRTLQVHWGCIHGDLHGENILLNNDCLPVFIDYGDVREGPLAMDWMTLECSSLFHPGAPSFDLVSAERVSPESWNETSSYSSNAHLTAFFSGCRERAAGEGLLPRELIAAAYSYVLRQLKYEDTDKGLALAILESLRNKFDS